MRATGSSRQETSWSGWVRRSPTLLRWNPPELVPSRAPPRSAARPVFSQYPPFTVHRATAAVNLGAGPRVRQPRCSGRGKGEQAGWAGYPAWSGTPVPRPRSRASARQQFRRHGARGNGVIWIPGYVLNCGGRRRGCIGRNPCTSRGSGGARHAGSWVVSRWNSRAASPSPITDDDRRRGADCADSHPARGGPDDSSSP